MPVKDTVAAHQFNRPITFQSQVDTPAGGGSATVAWSDYYTCWADIQNFPHARGLFRQFVAQQLYPKVNSVVAIRYTSDKTFNARLRISYKNRIYQIIGIEDPSEAHVSLLFFCSEFQAVGVG